MSTASVRPRPGSARARTRAALLEAALRVFARQGSTAAIHEITAEAGVANGTFYNYFRSREELVEAASMGLADELSSDVTASSTGVSDPAERVAIGCRRFLQRAEQDPTWGAALLRVWIQSPRLGERVGSALRADLRAGHRSGRLRHGSEPAALDLVQGAVLAGIRRIVEGRAPSGYATELVGLVLRGLGLPAAQADAVAQRPLPPDCPRPASPRSPR